MKVDSYKDETVFSRKIRRSLVRVGWQWGTGGEEESLDQVGDHSDDFILDGEPDTFIESIDANESWIRHPPKRHSVEGTSHRGYVLNGPQCFHPHFQHLVKDVRVLVNRRVDITFRRRKSLDERANTARRLPAIRFVKRNDATKRPAACSSVV